jgi:thiol-disulfide isomerase/thioredoxin
MNRILSLALLAFMVCTPVFTAADDAAEPVDFRLLRLDGSDLDVKALRGQWVVLNYWATWCAPCRKEIPELSALHSAREDIVVLGLTFEDRELEVFDEFLEEFNPSYPVVLVDVYAPPEPFGAPKVLPTTIILDPKGFPIKTFLGPVTREILEAFIDQEQALIALN